MLTTKNLIKDKAQALIHNETLRLDQDRVREDLMGLYRDIADELAEKAPGRETMIYEYAELMAREKNMYIPEEAYAAGLAAKGTERDKAFMDYIRRLHNDSDNQAVLEKRDAMFHELCGLLGKTSGLLNEFNELYRTCHGIISRKIDIFFDMGYGGQDGGNGGV